MLFTDDLSTINDSIAEDCKKLQSQYQHLKTTLEQCTNLSARLISDANKVSGQSFIKNIANQGIRSFGGQAGNAGSMSKMMNFMSQFYNNTRASGGNVTQGQPYLVGERGPEMFVPGSGGQIMPNNSRLNSRAVNIVMNITTPDAINFQKSRSQIVNELARAMRRADNI